MKTKIYLVVNLFFLKTIVNFFSLSDILLFIIPCHCLIQKPSWHKKCVYCTKLERGKIRTRKSLMSEKWYSLSHRPPWPILRRQAGPVASCDPTWPGCRSVFPPFSGELWGTQLFFRICVNVPYMYVSICVCVCVIIMIIMILVILLPSLLWRWIMIKIIVTFW